MSLMACPFCQTPLPATAQFCTGCGRPIPASSTTPVSPEPSPVSGADTPPVAALPPRVSPPPAQPDGAVCGHCGTRQTRSGATHCEGCGRPLAGVAAALPAGTAAKAPAIAAAARPRASGPGLRLWSGLAGIVILLGGLGGGGWWLWRWWEDSAGRDSGLVACEPVTVSEDFQRSNPNDLEGDLKADTYFAANEAYTIAAGATLRVPEGLTLLIEPGARVRFGEGARLMVEGTLSACGQPGRRILMTADSSSGRPGYWAGIELRSPEAGTVIGKTTIEFAGRDNHAPLWIEDGDILLDDVTFDSNQWYALSLDPNSLPQVRPPMVVDNGPQGWEIRGGSLTRTRAWSAMYPLILHGLVEVADGAQLTLAPGSTLKFLPESALRVRGELVATGTAEQPILFTSARADAEEGTPEPQAGDWQGLQVVGAEADVSIAHAELRYGGQGVACVWVEDAAPHLADVVISDCGHYSLSTNLNASPVLERLTLLEEDSARRWELRESQLQGKATRTLTPVLLADGQTPLVPTVSGWLQVGAQARLVLEAGMVLRFRGGDRAGLWSEGSLSLRGAPEHPVILTAVDDPMVGGSGEATAGAWAGVHLSGRPAEATELEQVEIRYAGAGDQGCLGLRDGASPTVSALTIRDCETFPISSDVGAEPSLTAVTLNDNVKANQWEIRESTLSGRRTLTWSPLHDAQGQPIERWVTGAVTVGDTATLELAPGLVVRFANPQAGLWIKGGSLKADGSLEQPILLTSWRDPEPGGNERGAEPGDWGGVWIEGAQMAPTLQSVTLRYAGVADRGWSCLTLIGSAPTLSDVHIEECGHYAVSSDLAANPTVERLSFRNNRLGDDWALRESRLSEGMERQLAGIAYLATGWLSVDRGAHLTLTPGVQLKFVTGTGLWVAGGLDAAGSAEQPILLTSWRDPELSREGTVQAGDWVGLVIEQASDPVRLEHVELRYAGGERNPRGAIVVTGSAPEFHTVHIRDSAAYPLSLDVKAQPLLDGLTLSDNLPANVVEIRGSTLDTTGEQVWEPWLATTPQPLVRVVTGVVVVSAQAALRLEGVVVRFSHDGGLDVSGRLQAADTLFTSLQDAEAEGETLGRAGDDPYWRGLLLRGSATSEITASQVRYADVGVWMERASPVLRDVTIDHSRTTALSADLVSAPELNGVVLEENTLNGLLLRAETLPDGRTEWPLLDRADHQVVRVLQQPLTIGPRAQLVIAPGVVVKFGSDAGLVVAGGLEMGERGSDTPVVLTALSDADSAGATQPDGPVPSRGAWRGIVVNPTDTGATLHLFGVTIQYAQIGLYLTDVTDWVFEALTIAHSQGVGISCDALSTIPTDSESDLTLIDNGEDGGVCPTPGR